MRPSSVDVAVALPPAPNIILIVADDLGYGDIGPYGAPSINTPALDQMAREGLLLANFLAAAPICTPSRAAMFTGRLPIRTGCYTHFGFPMDNFYRVFYPSSEGCMLVNETTIPELLQGSGGYGNTTMIGKWHLGHNADEGCLPGGGNRGFDDFFGLAYSHEEGYPGPVPEGVVWPPVPLFHNEEIVEQPFNGSDLTSRYTARAIEQLDAFAHALEEKAGAGEPPPAPFFMHLAYEAPHVPLFVGPEWKGRSRRGLFGDMVEEMDFSIGAVLDRVRASDVLAESTLCFFTSDNGAWVDPGSGLSHGRGDITDPVDGGSNGPFRGGKGSTWEGGLRVPGIAWWPGHIAPGQRSMVLTTMMDLLPTFAEIAGVELPKDRAIDGASFAGLLLGDGDPEPHADDCIFLWREAELYAVRSGPWKAHFVTRSGFNTSDPGTVHSPPLLFQLELDPGEKYPVNTTAGGDPEAAAALAAIEQAADEHRLDIARTAPSSQYEAQNWHLVPCCPRGEFDPIEAIRYARQGEFGLAIWDGCLCERDDDDDSKN